MSKTKLIWDGTQFLEVDAAKADELVEADKAQDLSKKFLSGTELKTRNQFTGYATRELKAAPAPTKDNGKNKSKRRPAKKS
jgi:hypothetical protein